jgi:hypothetical protein
MLLVFYYYNNFTTTCPSCSNLRWDKKKNGTEKSHTVIVRHHQAILLGNLQPYASVSHLTTKYRYLCSKLPNTNERRGDTRSRVRGKGSAHDYCRGRIAGDDF